MEMPPLTKAMVQTKKARAQLVYTAGARAQQAVALFAQRTPSPQTAARVPTKAAMHPLEPIPPRAQQEQPRRRLLRRMPGFGWQSGGFFRQQFLPRNALSTARRGE
jgi:hypothetical protein